MNEIEKRNIQIKLKVNQAEKSLFLENAAAAGYKSLSRYIRTLLAGKRIVSRTDVDMVNHIHKIGVNLNQLTHLCNQYKDDVIIHKLKVDIETTLRNLDQVVNEMRNR